MLGNNSARKEMHFSSPMASILFYLGMNLLPQDLQLKIGAIIGKNSNTVQSRPLKTLIYNLHSFPRKYFHWYDIPSFASFEESEVKTRSR